MTVTPALQASEDALKLGCSLSLELSQLLSRHGGALQLQLSSGGGLPDLGHPAARQGGKVGKDRIISYIPVADPGSPVGGGHQSSSSRRSLFADKGGKSPRPASPTHTAGDAEDVGTDDHSEISLPEGPQIAPELDFDPRHMIEFVSSPTKVEKGAVWRDGVTTPCEDMAWGPHAYRVLKAPPFVSPGEPGPAQGAQALSADEPDPELHIRVVDVVTERQRSEVGLRRRSLSARRGAVSHDHKLQERGGEKLLVPRLPRPSSARGVSQAQRGLHAGLMPSQEVAPVIEVRKHCWRSASRNSKRQLVLGAVQGPGEVSGLIHAVQRHGGRGAIDCQAQRPVSLRRNVSQCR
eukprot:TRINITY_DN79210_c0_g1_i1.p1 TRINITY_DN79210_c0_g1~~TRINITY_DN79210_c0_g1_i1.p1  ORF type:complete len:350 (-),score=50.98 TRINITY_DN79210_c0_g1_i1:185-1234(-)